MNAYEPKNIVLTAEAFDYIPSAIADAARNGDVWQLEPANENGKVFVGANRGRGICTYVRQEHVI